MTTIPPVVFENMKDNITMDELNSNYTQITHFPTDLDEEFKSELFTVKTRTHTIFKLFPSCHSEQTLQTLFNVLKARRCQFYYKSIDNGNYWGGCGKWQQLYNGLASYIPRCGYPQVELYTWNISAALSAIYVLSRVQHEFYNNCFMNVDICDVRDMLSRYRPLTICISQQKLTHSKLENYVGFNYFRMIKFIADTFDIDAAYSIVEAYQSFISEDDEICSTPDSEIEYESEDEYDKLNDSEFDDELEEKENENNYRCRKMKLLTEHYDEIEKRRNTNYNKLVNEIEKQIPLLGAQTMNYVRKILSIEEIRSLESDIESAHTMAMFNRVGFCIKSGKLHGETYKIGEFKRSTEEELLKYAKLEEEAKLAEESKQAKEKAIQFEKRIRDLESDKETHRKQLKRIEDEQKSLQIQAMDMHKIAERKTL